MSYTNWKTAWITGASTGIGREMALMLARGGTRVAATARSAGALQDLAASAGGMILPFPADVTDRSGLLATGESVRAALGPLDLVILNAGVLEPMNAATFDARKAARSMQVNYEGLSNGVEAVLPAMLARNAGHVAFIASVAGYRGVPRAAAYGPTKAAIINLSECLYHDLHGTGVMLSIVNPGFIDTPMTHDHRASMPWLVTAPDAAERILKGLQRKKYRIAFPWQTALLMDLARRAPPRLYFWFWRTFMGSGPMPPV